MTTEERVAELRERVAGPHVGSIYEEESYFREATEFLLDLLSRSALSSEDSERIDWLGQFATVSAHDMKGRMLFSNHWLADEALTLRKAIDAARHLSSTPKG